MGKLSLFFSPFILPAGRGGAGRRGRCPQLQLTPTKAEGFFPAGLAFYRNLFTRKSTVKPSSCSMDEEKLLALSRKQSSERICLVSSFSTELLEMQSEEPRLHVVFIPGNPGVVSFYKDFVEALYELLDGNASITGLGAGKVVLTTRSDKS